MKPEFQLGELMSVHGVEGCDDPRCRRNMVTGECMGWHCPRCGAATSMMGHACPDSDGPA